MSLLVVGSIALDNIQTPEGLRKEILGGSAVYFSLSASHFTQVRLVGVVGQDFPEEHVKMLNLQGVDTSGLMFSPGRTFRWSGRYEGDMNEAITLDTQLNVFAAFDPRIPDRFKDSQWVFLGNIDPGLQLKVMRQIPKTRLIALDTMNFWIQGHRDRLIETLASVNILFINDQEARMLAGTNNLALTARIISSMGPKTLVIKRGEYGSALYHRGEWFFVPGYPLDKISDPTGAGDSFAGGFMGSLARSEKITALTLRKAMIYGSIMASHKITGFGPFLLNQITNEDINQRFDEFRRFVALR